MRVARDRATGEEYACKAVPKVLGADASDAKRAGHVGSIKREVEVMRRLAGSLAVVRLVDVFEDDGAVYIVQELCRGGELHHRIGDRHYSERTVASFMRAALRTVAQCHAHRILHRDIKVRAAAARAGGGGLGGTDRAAGRALTSSRTPRFPPQAPIAAPGPHARAHIATPSYACRRLRLTPTPTPTPPPARQLHAAGRQRALPPQGHRLWAGGAL